MRRELAHRVEHALFRVVRAAVGVLPEGAALALGSGLGLVAAVLLRIRRADVDRHLAWAFPECSQLWRDRVARTSYRHLGREAVVLFRLGGWTHAQLRDRTVTSGFEELEVAVGEGRGVVLLTGHLGNWEIGGAAVAARGLPIDAVAKGMANERFERDLSAARERLGIRLIEMGDAPRAVLRSLREGRIVALLGDQNAHRSGVFVPFFGRMAASARGPALFAIRTGAPVFVGTALRREGAEPRYDVTFERLRFEPSGDPEEDVRAFTALYASTLEAAVRAAPGQYFWQHRRWKTRPPEEPGSSSQVTMERSAADRAVP